MVEGHSNKMRTLENQQAAPYTNSQKERNRFRTAKNIAMGIITVAAFSLPFALAKHQDTDYNPVFTDVAQTEGYFPIRNFWDKEIGRVNFDSYIPEQGINLQGDPGLSGLAKDYTCITQDSYINLMNIINPSVDLKTSTVQNGDMLLKPSIDCDNILYFD